MKRLTIAMGCALALLAVSCTEKSGWTELIDEDLSQWRIYQSYALTDEYVPWQRPTDADGAELPPVGYDVNLDDEFKVIDLAGEKDIPLVKGRIQLQSEAAEVYFKDIEIRPIDSIPEGYAYLFQ